MRRIEHLKEHGATFLLIRTDRLGDVILSTPVARVLRQYFPAMEIHFLVRKYTLPVVTDHPFVDRAWIDEDFTTFRNKVDFLRRHSFAGVIFLHAEPDWALAAFLARIPIRIGTGFRAFSIFFNKKVFVHRKNSGFHEADLNIALLRPLGIEKADLVFDFTIPQEAEEFIDNLIFALRLKRRFVALHPGSGGSAMDWPLSHFAKLADQIDEKLGLAVIFTGAQNEKSLVDSVLKQAKRKHIRLDGVLDIKQLAALYRRGETVVANSTGPLHLAVAVGKRVVGLYCPSGPCHPRRWGPYGQPDAALMPPLPECERIRKEKGSHFNCMELIPVARVLHKVAQTVGSKTRDGKYKK